MLTGDKKVNHKLKCRSINQLTTEKATKYYKDQPTLIQNKLCINILLTKYTELDKNLKRLRQYKIGEKRSIQTKYRQVLQFSSPIFNFYLKDRRKFRGWTDESFRFLFFHVSVKSYLCRPILAKQIERFSLSNRMFVKEKESHVRGWTKEEVEKFAEVLPNPVNGFVLVK